MLSTLISFHSSGRVGHGICALTGGFTAPAATRLSTLNARAVFMLIERLTSTYVRRFEGCYASEDKGR